MSSKIGKMSTQVKLCSPKKARECVLNPRLNSLSEPGAVSFLQPQPDLRHHSVHFGVRQGALRASESQGKSDAFVPVGNLRSTVFIECLRPLERGCVGVAGQLLDGREQRACGDGF